MIDNDFVEIIEPYSVKESEDENSIVLTFDDGVAYKYLMREYRKRHPKEVYWTMGNGKKINVKDMTDDHLVNAMNLITRKQEDEYNSFWLREDIF